MDNGWDWSVGGCGGLDEVLVLAHECYEIIVGRLV